MSKRRQRERTQTEPLMPSDTQPSTPPGEEDASGCTTTDGDADKNGSGQSELESSILSHGWTSTILTLFCRVSIKMADVKRSGRGIRRLVTLCGTIQQLVMENDRRLLDAPDSANEEEDPEAHRPSQDLQELARR